MESGQDYFVEISLDSVLRKATELEDSLRECRARAGGVPGEGRVSHQSTLCPEYNTVTAPVQLQEKSVSKPLTSTDISEQWQKLTAYIVSLEKEVQYYKQLVQDVQANRTTDTQGNRDYCTTSMLRCPTGHHLDPRAVAGQEGQPNAEYWRVLLDEEPENHALFLIFSYLSAQALNQAALVCHKWYRVSRHPCLWKEVVMSEAMVEPEALFRLAQWCFSTERIVLHGLMPPIALPDEDLQSYIINTRGSLEPGLKALMEASSLSLNSLTITECNLMATERVLWLASIHCPNLCSLTYCSDEFPPSSESLWSLANGCRYLQHLTLPPVPDSPNASWFNDNCMSVIAHAWPGLISLTVGGSSITPDGLKEIAQKCLKLQYLEVIYGPSLHKEAIEKLCMGRGLQSLVRLIFNFTPASHLALELLIEKCSCLELLEMHVTMKSYFTETDSNTIPNYTKIISNIKKLRKHSKGKKIFHLYEH